MAYGVKWLSYLSDIYADVRPGVFLVEILERDYAGAAIRVKSQASAVEIEMTTLTDPTVAIRPLKFLFNWIAQDSTNFEISELVITDDRKYKLQVSKLDENNVAEILYYGFLTPVNCEEPLLPKPYSVTLAGTCGLPFLRDDYYLDGFGSFVEGKQSLIKIIANCLKSTGLDLPIHTYISLFEESMPVGADSALKLAEIDADGLRGMKAMEVLEGVLNAFRAFIIQGDGAWIIKSLKDQVALKGTVRKFNSNGDSTGMELVDQSASFGRPSSATEVPNVRPMGRTVKKSIAMQNSIVRNRVDAGIAVNRLPNGTFSGPILGGNVPGWIVNLNGLDGGAGPTGWQRTGNNSPEDSYKIDISGALPTPYRRTIPQRGMKMSGYIEFIPGNFPNAEAEPFAFKVIFTGAFRASDISFFQLFVRLNEGRDDRKYHSYMDNDGAWHLSKKTNGTDNVYCKINVDVPVDIPTSKKFEDSPLQTFEITSQPITNYLQRDGKAVVRLYYDIIAPQVMVGAQGEMSTLHPRCTWEDFAIIVTTETAFEGPHTYEIDAKFPIRNPNSAEYTTIIADKINIETPEQSRPINRVLTGYMTRLDGSLTKGWKHFPGGTPDPTDPNFEPIQHKSLRQSIRLLCGKRGLREGKFFGYGLRPDHTVFNVKDPGTLYSVTGWRWDIRNMEYTLTLSELKFPALSEEVIDLVGDEDGRRGNRMYAGGGGSHQSNGNGSGKPVIPIVVDPIPAVYFTVGVQHIQLIHLADFLGPDFTPIELEAFATHFDMPSHVGIDRGEEGNILDILITAKPTTPGTDRVLIELIGPDDQDYLVIIHLIAVPATKFIHTLINKTGGGNVVVGKLKAGSGYLKPNLWAIETEVDGFHEGYYQGYNGPGAAGATAAPYVVVEGNDSDTYATGATASQVGTFNYEFSTWRNEGDPDLFAMVKKDAFRFLLFDAAYLNKCKFELWVDGAKLGDINPDGSSAFNTEGKPFQIKIIVDGVLHDTATAVLRFGGADIKTHVYTQNPSVEDVTYDLYEVLPAAQAKGLYELSFTADEENENIYERLIAFTINEKKKTAVGGSMKLVSMIPGTSNYNVMGTLTLAGGSYVLPASGWNALADAPIVAGTTRSHRLFQLRAGSLIVIDTSLHTGRPQSRTYSEDLDTGDYLIFGFDSSLDIDNIHKTPSTFRLEVTDEVEGVVTNIYSADFSFGPAVNLDDIEIEEPGGEIAEVVAGPGNAHETIDYVRIIRGLVDNSTIEIFEPQGIYDPASALKNWYRVKNKGITFAKIQDIPGKTVIGNMNAALGVPYAVKVVDLLEDADIGDLITAIAVKNYIKQQLESSINGTIGFLPIYATAHSFGNSIIRQTGSLIGIGMAPSQELSVAGDILATGQLISNIGTGTAPLVVASSTLVANLHADYLNKSIFAGLGMTGGGLMTDNRTLNLGTPSTLDASTGNSVTGTTHTHAINTGNLVQGTNVDLSGILADRLIGLGNVTISVNDFPWSSITGRPSTIPGYGITDAYTKAETDALLATKENVFAKGGFAAGSNVDLSGTLTNRLVGSGTITISVNDFPWSSITGKPSTLAGYGITDGATDSELSAGLATKENTFAKGSLVQGVGVSLSGTLANRLVGSGNVTITVDATGVTGSGTKNRIAKWDVPGTGILDSRIYDEGVGDVEVFAGFKVSGDRFVLPTLSQGQRASMSPPAGTLVYQSNSVGSSLAGLKYFLFNQWAHVPWNFTDV